MHAYLNPKQEELITEKFEIEHIFPKRWQNTNYNGWNKEDAEEYLERLGNKVVIDKKTNISAGNNYFGTKKQRYDEKFKEHQIADLRDLIDYKKDDWLKEDIEKREEQFIKRLMKFFTDNLQNKS